MPALSALTTFAAGLIVRSEHNANWAALRTWADNSVVHTDVAKTITVTHTFSAAQTFSSTINGQTISSAASFTGTLAVAGVATLASRLVFSTAASQIVPGATSLSLRNNANGADNVLVSDAGVVTIRAGLTITAGGITVTAGGLTISAGGAAITGNSTITGNLTVTGSLTGSVGASSYVRRTSDLNFTASTDLTLTFAIGAADEWEFEYVLAHTNASVATGSFVVNGPASSTGFFGGISTINGAPGAVQGDAELVIGNAISGISMSTTTGFTSIRGYIKGGGSSGNVTIAGTVSAGTGVLKAGSYVRYARIA